MSLHEDFYLCNLMKLSKLNLSILIILVILILDQVVKFYIKLNYPIGEVTRILGADWARIHFIENSGMAWAGSWEMKVVKWRSRCLGWWQLFLGLGYL